MAARKPGLVVARLNSVEQGLRDVALRCSGMVSTEGSREAVLGCCRGCHRASLPGFQLVDASVEFAKAGTDPSPSDALEYVYAEEQ